eukprot:CAMPEP_0179282388 /NCGR_PEP_ID=MMETSP0797-20121207/37643_1 /TAXON_ID=47934 /ORGANISM="Dinophysis acuminata, Strain DAEP01" /LENGTH=361 /DNA_ID=CAMNT_0020991125 /DNA_START=39 /DNA_END=1124 /DNA_ORIENTATION=+
MDDVTNSDELLPSSPAPSSTDALSLKGLRGKWSFSARVNSVAIIAEDGRTLYNGRHMGSEYDIAERSDGASITVARADGWLVDVQVSSSDRLVWTKPGEGNMTWWRLREDPMDGVMQWLGKPIDISCCAVSAESTIASASEFQVAREFHTLHVVLAHVKVTGNRLINQTTSLEHLREKLGTSCVTALTECRHLLPICLPIEPPRGFHHAFTMLEIGGFGKDAICLEKFDHNLEVMYGLSAIMQEHVTKFRATGEERAARCIRPVIELPRTPLGASVDLPDRTVNDVCDWIVGPLAASWEPYDPLTSNCQHFARDLRNFLGAKRARQRAPGRAQLETWSPGVLSEEVCPTPCESTAGAWYRL